MGEVRSPMKPPFLNRSIPFVAGQCLFLWRHSNHFGFACTNSTRAQCVERSSPVFYGNSYGQKNIFSPRVACRNGKYPMSKAPLWYQFEVRHGTSMFFKSLV